MAFKGYKRNFPLQGMLTESQIEKAHRATLRVLWETGVTVEHEKALKLFADNGCKVDFQTKRVRFPQWLVESCLAKVPSTMHGKARDPENDIYVPSGGDEVIFGSSNGMNLMDLKTMGPMMQTRKDYYDYIKLFDALPNLQFQGCFPMFGFENCPPNMMMIEGCAAHIRNTSKVIQDGWVLDNYKWFFEMAKVTGQDVFLLLNPTPPLYYPTQMIDAIYACVENDQPFHVASGPVAGATGPATIIGTVILDNCDCIPGMILSQLIRPGARVWAGEFASVQNMATGSPGFGAIETALIGIAHSQMWDHYKIPVINYSCGMTTSKVMDYQSGYETALGGLIAATSGSGCVILHGSLNNQLEVHPIKAVLDDDLAGIIGRYLRGIEVSDETMAADVICNVGPMPGHFLSTAHTRKWWKKEQYLPKVEDRSSYAQWVKNGKKESIERANERLQEILATHKVNPLTAQQEQSIEDILKEARAYYRKNGQISDDEWAIYQKDLASPEYPFA
jgi:trimethylamine--corrinoid protein Co-methyltransferase